MSTRLVNRSLRTVVVFVPDLDVHPYDVNLCSLLFDIVAANDDVEAKDVEARLLHLQVADDRWEII